MPIKPLAKSISACQLSGEYFCWIAFLTSAKAIVIFVKHGPIKPIKPLCCSGACSGFGITMQTGIE